jgi:hypothetical protein
MKVRQWHNDKGTRPPRSNQKSDDPDEVEALKTKVEHQIAEAYQAGRLSLQTRFAAQMIAGMWHWERTRLSREGGKPLHELTIPEIIEMAAAVSGRELAKARKARLKQALRERGMSPRTSTALVEQGLDMPERLLFMTEDEVKALPGIGPFSLGDIMRYRAQWLPAPDAIALYPTHRNALP